MSGAQEQGFGQPLLVGSITMPEASTEGVSMQTDLLGNVTGATVLHC